MDITKSINSDIDESEDSESEEAEKPYVKYKWLPLLARDNQEMIESGVFYSKSSDQIKWKLQLYPSDKNEADKNFMSLQLYLVSSDASELEIFCECLISSYRAGRKLIRRASILHMNTGNNRTAKFPRVMSKHCPQDNVIVTLTPERLRIFCRLFVMSKDPIRVNARLSDDLGKLMKDQKLTDVTLIASNIELKAHKAILAARSPVFAKMFEHDMREKRSNIVRISDVDHEILQEVIRFVYTGKVKNVKKNACGLIAVADKYQLEEMKNTCEAALLKGLRIGNAIGTLVVADRFNVDKLKRKVIEFINLNARRIVDTPSFKALSKSQAYLIMEAYSMAAIAFNGVRKLRYGLKKRSHLLGLKSVRKRGRRSIGSSTWPRAFE